MRQDIFIDHIGKGSHQRAVINIDTGWGVVAVHVSSSELSVGVSKHGSNYERVVVESGAGEPSRLVVRERKPKRELLVYVDTQGNPRQDGSHTVIYSDQMPTVVLGSYKTFPMQQGETDIEAFNRVVGKRETTEYYWK